MRRERCDHAWHQQTTTIAGRPTPIARWVCARCGDATDADPTPVPGSLPPPGGARTFGGSGSWSVRVSSGEALDAALWLRDAFALPVAPSPLVPPPLARPPEVRHWPGDPTTAAATWSTWWASLAGDDRSGPASAPPKFAPWWDDALSAARPAPALTPEQADAQARARVDRERFPHGLLARVVDDVTFDLDVAPGELHGAVVLLSVTGAWWSLVAPGRALAAADVVADETALHALLDAVLRSAATS